MEDNNQFNNNDVNNYYESNKNLNRVKKKTNPKFVVAIIGVLLLCISFFIIYNLNSKKDNDELYTSLTQKICNAAKKYVYSENYDKELLTGESAIIKFSALSDLNLIEAKIENPYYEKKLFNKNSQEKYYSMDNSVRVLALGNEEVYCELINNGNDVNSPNLRLNGDKEIILAVGTTYADPGFIATDDFDGDLTSRVAMSGTYNPLKAGKYEIAYTVQDSAGNATTMKRNLIFKNFDDLEPSTGSIRDTETPKIMLKGSNPYCMLKGTKYVEPGVIATDNVDGDITDRISVINNVTGNLVGSFRVEYRVEDSSGNQTTVYRAVTVSTKCLSEDKNTDINSRPEITLIGKNSVTIELGSTYIDLGATAYDKEDGNITDKIITDSSLVNVNLPGVYNVIYRVTDSKGATSSNLRTVTVKSNSSQKSFVSFTETKDNINVPIGEGNNSLIAAPKAVDENGNKVNVTTKIEDYTTKQIYNSINWNEAGKYRVIYTAIHNNGSIRQTKSIVVTIELLKGKLNTLNDIIIWPNKEAEVPLRNENCDITEYDLINSGVIRKTNDNITSTIVLYNNKDVACKTGTYKVDVAKVYSDGNKKVESKKTSVTVNVVEYKQDSVLHNTLVNNLESVLKNRPTKVEVISNSATPNDLYNINNTWIGGNKTGIKLGFKTISTAPINRFEYSFDGETVAGSVGVSKTNGSIVSGVLNWTQTGQTRLYIRAVSAASISGPWSDEIHLNIDVTGPTIKFTHSWEDEKEDWHNVSSLTVEYQGVDKESGLSHFEYTFDDVKAKKSSDIVTHNESSGKITIYENTEPTKEELFVYVRAVDKAGNKGEWTKKPAFVNLDTVKPSAPTLSVTGNNTKLVKINATFNDGKSTRESGFGKLIYTLNNGSKKNEEDKVITMPTNSTSKAVNYTVKVWAVDKAGNQSATSSSKNVTVAANAVKVTGVTLKNGSTKIKNNAVCSSNELKPGNQLTLTATPTPSNAKDTYITWNSSDKSIATVDNSGKITAIKAGETTITAKINDVETKCKLVVKPAIVNVTSIKVKKESEQLEIGTTKKIELTINPSNATNAQIEWTSSNSYVAEVDENGVITAKQVGNTFITAKTENGKTASVYVIVAKPKLTISNEKITLIDETTKTLKATLSVKALDKGVTWVSSNPAIATVDANGKVKAKLSGTTTIIATSKYDSTIKAYSTVTVRAAKFLFIGNSKTYFPESEGQALGIPFRFKQIAANAGYDIVYETAIKGSTSLNHIISDYPDRVQKIKKSYDYVIMNEGTGHPYNNKEQFHKNVDTITDWVKEKNPNVKVFIRKTWVKIDTAESRIKKAFENTDAIAKEIGIGVINDGPAFYDVINNHNINIMKNQDGVKDDFVHQNNNGAYLSALCMFAEVYDKDPTKITYNSAINTSDANTLKQIAKKHCYKKD